MNIKHGFYSKDAQLNGDMRLLQGADLTGDQLGYAESFLFGDDCSNPIAAHEIVKAIFVAGKRRHPTLWDKAEKYVHGYEYHGMEKLSAT